MNCKSLKQRYLESLGSEATSLSMSNISRFYVNYIKNNKKKVKDELNRVGYFVLKNKVSIGNSSTTTKDIFVSTYFVMKTRLINAIACYIRGITLTLILKKLADSLSRQQMKLLSL